MNHPSRFLIIQTAFIGDVILATALVEELHARYPEAAIDFLLRKGNESLLKDHPIINQLLIWDKKKGFVGKYGDLLRLLGEIRRNRYDVVINLQRFGATGLLTAFSQAPVRAGFDKNPFSRYFTHRAMHQILPGIHEVDRNAEVLEVIGLDRPRIRDRTRPRLYPAAADYDSIRHYQTRPYICVAPTSVWFTKQYPRTKWVQFLKTLPGQYTVYLLGSPADRETCAELVREAGSPEDVINLCGELSLLESAALMQGAAMNYVNDSAPLHLCSAMNAPTAAVFCSTVPEFGFGPLADESHLIQLDEVLECRPCGLHGRKRCPLGHFYCAHGIRTEQLLAVLRD
ncbi:glycosyltransferase family 9 protein [Tellurirhabdus rosea]|uniref:glycosyltransferase family 9 protein n=1 Tax=Tellurirhabdus rosea TaxID=2674997 RepID=UPI0022564147|nr:glycosyltransferase family 9 protein [Tellurirhabdus rosea]